MNEKNKLNKTFITYTIESLESCKNDNNIKWAKDLILKTKKYYYKIKFIKNKTVQYFLFFKVYSFFTFFSFH